MNKEKNNTVVMSFEADETFSPEELLFGLDEESGRLVDGYEGYTRNKIPDWIRKAASSADETCYCTIEELKAGDQMVICAVDHNGGVVAATVITRGA
jgi:hypothetical protein